MKHKFFIITFLIFLFISCNNNSANFTKILGEDSTLIGKHKTEYRIHYSTYERPKYIIYSDKEVYTCSFQGTNFLLEKDNTEEILSTTAPIEIIKSEIVK